MTATTGIDHAIIGVRDLEEARRTYERLGFTICPRGRHIGWGTANYCIMFPDDYLELLGIVDPSQFTNNLDKFLEIREGFLGLAFASGDAEAAALSLKAAGIETDGPKDLKRILELPDGEVQPAFKLLHLPAAATPGLPAFICQHLTRDLVWQPQWLDHPNTARMIHSVTVVVDDPGALANAYGILLGPEAVRSGDGYVEVAVGPAWLRFTTPAGLQQLYPAIANLPSYPAPWLAGLRVAVADIGTAASVLDAIGVAYVRDGDDLLRLPAEAACGVLFEFVSHVRISKESSPHPR